MQPIFNYLSTLYLIIDFNGSKWFKKKIYFIVVKKLRSFVIGLFFSSSFSSFSSVLTHSPFETCFNRSQNKGVVRISQISTVEEDTNLFIIPLSSAENFADGFNPKCYTVKQCVTLNFTLYERICERFSIFKYIIKYNYYLSKPR